MMSQSEYSQKRQQQAIDMIRAGADVSEIIRKTAYSVANIRSLASAIGVSLAGRNDGPRTLKILGLIRAGKSNAEIAEETGVTPGRVPQVRKAALEAGALLPGDIVRRLDGILKKQGEGDARTS